MGSYTFKWEHPAEEVYVTGTFDGWSKSVQLEKKGDVFEKTVELPDASSKIYYKYVVDNSWVINESSPKEPDHEGNINNFLTPEQIAGPAAAIINTVTADSTTAKMAGEQPLEKDVEKPTEVATPSDVPGGFPVTPANELDKPIGIAPLPAADGAVNPIDLAPGEKIPESISAQNVNEHVKLDKESYEKSDALAGVDMTLPEVSKSAIPEAGLPVAEPPVTIQTVGAGATTAVLAGEVPLEPKVPAVVKESQEKADAAPEASAVPAEVAEKAQVEEELKAKVPEAPSTSEGVPELGTVKSENDGVIAGTVAAAGAAVAAAAAAATNSVTPAVAAATDAVNKNLPDSVKEKLPEAAQEVLASHNKEEKREEVSPEVPAEVKESIAEAGKAPEAAANTEAVIEKKEVEAELLKEVKSVPAVDETPAETKAEAQTDAKATQAEEKLKTEAIKSDFKAETEKAKAEAAEVKEAAADSKKEQLEAKAEKVEAQAEAKVEEAKAAVTGAAGDKAEQKAANGSETKAAEASSSKPAENGTETKKKHRFSSIFSKLKAKMK